MSIKKINVGAVQNDGTGDQLRDAFVKVNENFEELESSVGSVSAANAAALLDRANHTGEQAIASVTGLQSALAEKANTSATQTALNGKANTSHTHAVADVTGLQAALDAKANTSHTHAVADVTGLQAALDGTMKTTGDQTVSGKKTFESRAVIRNGDPTLFLRNTTHLSSMIHVNSNYFYVLRGEVDSETWAMVNNQWPLIINLTNNDALFGGNVTASGNVNTSSDERLKVNWKPVDSGFLDGLANIQSGTYTRKDIGTEQVGVSAQDIQKLLPEAVSADADGFLSLAYGNAALVACVELAKEMVALKKRIAELEGA